MDGQMDGWMDKGTDDKGDFNIDLIGNSTISQIKKWEREYVF